MGIVILIVTGAIVGWLGFRLAGYPNEGGCLTNIVIGIGGGMLGGALLTLATGDDLLFSAGAGGALLDFVASVIGATLLILLLKALGRRT